MLSRCWLCRFISTAILLADVEDYKLSRTDWVDANLHVQPTQNHGFGDVQFFVALDIERLVWSRTEQCTLAPDPLQELDRQVSSLPSETR
jgi:hypothetical protein